MNMCGVNVINIMNVLYKISIYVSVKLYRKPILFIGK